MAPDLPEKLLGIDIDEADDRQRGESTDADDEAELEWFVFFRVDDHRLALPVDDVKTITEIPADVTRIPRSPPAIEGVTDLRGEITAVIDPGVHFSTDADRSGRERLLVFDRPTDEQSAAIQIDDVIGVDPVPRPDVLDADAIRNSELSGDALEHPLIAAIIEQERERDADGRSVADSNGPGGIAADAGSAGTPSAGGEPAGTGSGRALGGAADLETDDPPAAGRSEPTAEAAREVVVTATPLIDVERLLLASGHTE